MTLNRSNLCWLALALITAGYLLFWAFLLGATATYSTPDSWLKVLMSPEIRHATWLSLVTCSLAAGFALLLAVPVGYLMSRREFRGKSWLDAALDIPIILPPLVVGLCLLIFFQTWGGKLIENGFDVDLSPIEVPESWRPDPPLIRDEENEFTHEYKKPSQMGDHWKHLLHVPGFPFTYQISGVILAQFVVAAAFAIRTMRGTFQHLSARPEDVALTLGCTRFQALWHVALPAARRGMVAAFCIAWARSLGEFGPILVFAGATRMKTEVLPTTVWLELSVGNLEAAVAVSLFMVALAVLVLVAVRATGEKV
ncbi:MAG TPA: molybdenum ABC transporter permease [Verrucomicrobiales bacterium]|nr:molybdenum ABC transporter permease [Verrucomicrobiales bacterium]